MKQQTKSTHRLPKATGPVPEETPSQPAEEALRESEARLRALIDNLPFEFWAMDRNLRYIMQNVVSLKNHGDVVGKRIEELGLPPEVAAQWVEQDTKVLRGEILRDEYERNVKGEKRAYESFTAPVIVGEAIVGIVGIGMDITERKQADDALRESEARYHRLFEQTQATLAETQALYRVSRSVIALESLADMLQTAVEAVANALSADRVTLITFDLEAQQVTHFVRGGPGADQVIRVLFEELWSGLSGWVLRELRPALSPKSTPDPRESLEVQRRRAETNCGDIIVVPLCYQDKPLFSPQLQ